MKRLLPLFILLTVAGSLGQQLPTLSYETVVFNAVTSTGVSPVPTTSNPGKVCNTPNSKCAIQNTGTGAHTVSWCIVSGTANTVTLELEGSNDGTITAGIPTPTNWQQISQQATQNGNGCGQIGGGGYYQWLRVNLITLTGTGMPTITIWYSGIGTAIPGQGILISNQGSQPTTFNPSLGGTFPAKSTPVSVSIVNAAVYALSASNPNTVPVFVTLLCNSIPTEFEIPANDTRDVPLGTPGMICTSPSTVACSTSAGSATDPTNTCFINVAWKNYQTVNTQINAAGTVTQTTQQVPN